MKGFKEFWKFWKNDCPPCAKMPQFDPKQNNLKPLAMAESGKRLKVCRVIGGRGVCARLAHMGIYPGVEMELLCGGCDSPCIVKVHNVTISLGRGVSQKIMVEEIGR
ncbi:MAG: FeoA family protein [Thermodesulforhabdaceae bacterium]